MANSTSMALKVKQSTRNRVQRRIDIAKRPYVARRRDFNTRPNKLGLMMAKALLAWTLV